MRLIDDAGKVAKRAWSLRLAVGAAALSAAEVALPFFYPDWPPRIAAAAAFVVTLAAMVARFIAQPRMRDGDDSA